MAAPIGDTPVLSGKVAEEWWNTVESQKDVRFVPRPTPELEEVRKEILENAKNKRKKQDHR